VTLRVPLAAAALVGGAFVLASTLLVISPRLVYSCLATSAYADALALWQAADHPSYAVIVLSNSLTEPTGGTYTFWSPRSRLASKLPSAATSLIIYFATPFILFATTQPKRVRA
jgi:hypothetical protein